MRGKMIEQRTLVLREAEEVVPLLDPLQRERRVQRTFAVDEIFFLLEGLASLAIPAFVRPFVDIARVMDAARQVGDAVLVPRLGRADEVVERHVEPPPGARE